MRNCLKQLEKLGEAIVRDLTLLAEVMVVGRNLLKGITHWGLCFSRSTTSSEN